MRREWIEPLVPAESKFQYSGIRRLKVMSDAALSFVQLKKLKSWLYEIQQ